jgi:hypothetical protein
MATISYYKIFARGLPGKKDANRGESKEYRGIRSIQLVVQ